MDEKEKTAKTKKRFHSARIIVSILIVVIHIIPIWLTLDQENVLDGETETISGVSIVILSILVVTIATMMTVALWKFTAILSGTTNKADLRIFIIFIEILSIMTWAAASFAIGLEFCIAYDEIFYYQHIRAISIMDLVTVDASVVNFGIIGLILYKSSKVASMRRKLAVTDPTQLQGMVKNEQSQAGNEGTNRNTMRSSETAMRLTATNDKGGMMEFVMDQSHNISDNNAGDLTMMEEGRHEEKQEGVKRQNRSSVPLDYYASKD